MQSSPAEITPQIYWDLSVPNANILGEANIFHKNY
jgi:hypothetical protein